LVCHHFFYSFLCVRQGLQVGYEGEYEGVIARPLLSILRNPLLTQKELARETGYSPSQISRIICSPDFQDRYQALFYDTASQTARFRWLGR
jgi:hypothetical protein